MGHEKPILFDSFRLDPANEYLWKDSQAIRLRPKAFAVLLYLANRPGQLITKDELLDAVWPGTYVGEAVLKVTIRQIRQALEDQPESPRFIETAHRRGYRFIAQIDDSVHGSVVDRPIGASPDVLYSSIVGREDRLSQMKVWLERAMNGRRQVGFIAGEAGIGKSALVDLFTRSIAPGAQVRIGRGQCLEHYGTSEAYLPVLDAMGRLCREDSRVIDALRTHAPMWLLQMPSLVSASDRDLLNRAVFGATRERMLREMGEALESLTADVPLVLVLEDLHWSDYSTLDLVSYLARQNHPARLLLIGTYRTAEAAVHPLKAVKRELAAKQQCEELALECLTREAVAGYLSIRFPDHQFSSDLSGLIHKRTEGNPLFMVNAVDYLQAEGLIGKAEGSWRLLVDIGNIEVKAPDSIKQMIDKQIDHVSAADQRMLEAASAAGAEFSAIAVAAALGEDRAPTEARCDQLARQRQFIQHCGVQTLPNGEAVGRYSFIHALYQKVLYGRLSPARRVQLHRRIGVQLQKLYADRAQEIAAELAMHFERGQHHEQALKYGQLAAENDIRRFAYREAVAVSRRGLELLHKMPETTERDEQELRLLLTLGAPLIATQGYAAPDVGITYVRARDLCRHVGEPQEISRVLWGLWTFYTLRGELGTARQIAEELMRLAEGLPNTDLAMSGHWALEATLMHLGDFTPAVEHFEKAIALYDPGRHLDNAFLYAQNPGVAMRGFASWALWFLGKPTQALQPMNEALSLARELSEPHGLAHALFFAAILHQLRRESGLAQESAEAALELSKEHGLPLYEALATVARGWSVIHQGRAVEGARQIRQGLAAHQATGGGVLVPHFLGLLAEAFAEARKPAEGLLVVQEALSRAEASDERCYQAELCRLKGELFLQQPSARERRNVSMAEACFRDAVRIARQQHAKALELRAAVSLARLLRNRTGWEEAQAVLQRAYGAFNEGFETEDLREAKALIDD